MNILPFLNNSNAVAIKIEITANDLVDVIKRVTEETVEILLSKLIVDKPSDFITRKDAMTLLNVKTAVTMIRWEEKGYLIPHKISNRIYYRKNEVLKALEVLNRDIYK